MNKARYTAVIAAAAILLAFAAGCNTQSENTASQTSETASVTSSADTESSAADESSEEESEEEKPIPVVSDPTPESSGEYIEGLFLYNGTAYELFYGDEDMAKNYAETISYVKKGLGDKIKVYNLLVPTHVGVDLPDKFSEICNPQDTYIKAIFDSYDADITGVSAYDEILRHRDEYIYFNSDHHWTGRGAYYAYKALAKAAGYTPIKLEDMKSEKINGYYGSLSWTISEDLLTEDYVEYFTTDSKIDCMRYDENASNPYEFALIHDYAEGSNAYGVFLGGDQPLMVAKNPDGNGKKIAVVKESYGNAFCPFIAYTYSETHMIDFRYVEFNLKDYLEKNGIDEVIFINNTMASATSMRCDEMRNLVDSSSGAGSDDNDESVDYDDANIEDYL